MSARALLPALLLLAASVVPAAEALGADPEAPAGGLPPPQLPCVEWGQDPVPLVLGAVECVAYSGGPCGPDPCCLQCFPQVGEAIDYLQQVVAWFGDYGQAIGAYSDAQRDELLAYVLALHDYLVGTVVVIDGDLLALAQYAICLVGGGDCGPIPLSPPPLPPLPTLLAPPLPPPPPQPWLLQGRAPPPI